MNAREHTDWMLCWSEQAGITRADLAVRRPAGTFVWHHNVTLKDLPLAWARAENVRGSEIYIRPARGYSWPLLFLDDVSPVMTRRVTRAYAALVIHTSPAGGCHLWIRSDRALDEAERSTAQRWLATRTGADPRSASGEHLGRLAGFKNWKRGGTWINLVEVSRNRPAWNPAPALRARRPAQSLCLTSPRSRPVSAAPPALLGRDTSPSGREWAWVCSMLETGADPSSVLAMLLSSASQRRGNDALRYARQTLRRAILKTASSMHTYALTPKPREIHGESTTC